MFYSDLNLWKWTDGICTTHTMTLRRGLTKSPPVWQNHKVYQGKYIYIIEVCIWITKRFVPSLLHQEKKKTSPASFFCLNRSWDLNAKFILCACYLFAALKASPSGQPPSRLPWALGFPKTRYSGKTFA